MTTHLADEDELQEIRHYVAEYCRLFDQDADAIMDSPFTVVTPDSSNPYKQNVCGELNHRQKPPAQSQQGVF